MLFNLAVQTEQTCLSWGYINVLIHNQALMCLLRGGGTNALEEIGQDDES